MNEVISEWHRVIVFELFDGEVGIWKTFPNLTSAIGHIEFITSPSEWMTFDHFSIVIT